MNALLKLIPLSTLLNYVVSIFLGALPSLLPKARQLVTDAEAQFPSQGSGAAKKAWVYAQLTSMYKQVKPHIIDTIYGIAVQVLQKKLGKV